MFINIVFPGIDLAKNLIALHGVDAARVNVPVVWTMQPEAIDPGE